MMKSTALLCLAFLAAPALAVDAPTASQPLQVRGDVPVRCRVSAPVGGSALNASFSPSADGGNLTLTSLVDPNSAITNASQGAVAFPITCVGAQSVTVTSQGGGLSNASVATATGGFSTHVNYTMTASWAGRTETAVTAGSAVTLDLSATSPQTGSLTISFSVAAGQGPLVGGTYTDQVVIQVNAQ